MIKLNEVLFIYCIQIEYIPALCKTTTQEVEEEGRKFEAAQLNTVARIDKNHIMLCTVHT